MRGLDKRDLSSVRVSAKRVRVSVNRIRVSDTAMTIPRTTVYPYGKYPTGNFYHTSDPVPGFTLVLIGHLICP